MLLGLSLVWAATRLIKARFFILTLNFLGFLAFIAVPIVLMVALRS